MQTIICLQDNLGTNPWKKNEISLRKTLDVKRERERFLASFIVKNLGLMEGLILLLQDMGTVENTPLWLAPALSPR